MRRYTRERLAEIANNPVVDVFMARQLLRFMNDDPSTVGRVQQMARANNASARAALTAHLTGDDLLPPPRRATWDFTTPSPSSLGHVRAAQGYIEDLLAAGAIPHPHLCYRILAAAHNCLRAAIVLAEKGET